MLSIPACQLPVGLIAHQGLPDPATVVIIESLGNDVFKRAENDTLVSSKAASVDECADDLPALVVATGLIEALLSNPSISSRCPPHTPKYIKGIKYVCYYSGCGEGIRRVDRLVESLQVQVKAPLKDWKCVGLLRCHVSSVPETDQWRSFAEARPSASAGPAGSDAGEAASVEPRHELGRHFRGAGRSLFRRRTARSGPIFEEPWLTSGDRCYPSARARRGHHQQALT